MGTGPRRMSARIEKRDLATPDKLTPQALESLRRFLYARFAGQGGGYTGALGSGSAQRVEK